MKEGQIAKKRRQIKVGEREINDVFDEQVVMGDMD
jgi:hypothetical protein